MLQIYLYMSLVYMCKSYPSAVVPTFQLYPSLKGLVNTRLLGLNLSVPNLVGQQWGLTVSKETE